jgi:hypothetical protein
MSSTLRVVVESKVSVTETFAAADPSNPDATFAALNETLTLTAATAVPVTKQATFDQAMSAGAATIDLAALPGKTADETVVGTGLKVQVLKLVNPDTNANPITVAKGASNGHTLLGASWTLTLKPGQSALFYFDEAAPDVSSGDRTIDVSGTGSQALSVHVVLG